MPNEWQAVLDELKNNVSEMAFNTYFGKSTTFIKIEDQTIVLSAPVFIRTSIEKKYRDAILKAIKASGVKAKDFKVIEASVKKKINRGGVEILPGAPSSTSTPGTFITAKKESRFSIDGTGLNPKYRLNNYVIGKNNDLAVSAAQAVIENPGIRYNPYFIYGGPGLGKTHLIQAIGNELHEKRPDLKILYVTIEEFYHDFVMAMKMKLDGFQDKYRKVDVLIIDDFQFIAGKDASQEEFFHTFNELREQNKQIIVSCDRLPSQIAKMDERLSSRLTMGVSIDIQLPDFETRCAIIKSKAELLGKEIDNETVEYLAENISTNIRDLEGELNKVLLYAEMRGVPTSDIIKDIAPTIQPIKHHTTPKQVVERVARYYNIPSKELFGTSRVKDVKNARQVAMFLMNKDLNLSTTKIGDEFKKDHSTVIHGIRMVNDKIKTDFTLREQISELRSKIYAN